MRRIHVVVDYTLRPPKGTRVYRAMETIKVKFEARPRIQGEILLFSRIQLFLGKDNITDGRASTVISLVLAE
jgi:hypothetical protein